VNEHDDAPLLIHSLETVADLILRAFDIAAPARIVEIGSETGGFTLRMADWAREHGATLVSVDPDPAARLREVSGEHLELVAAASPWALEGIEPGDAYVVDGDHNHWTVLRELRAAFGDRRPGPLVVLHDVAWPWNRRDAYYAPDRIPADARHEHAYWVAVRPGDERTVESGFSGRGDWAIALHEGGERNGVLTAVEDFMTERQGLRLLRLPAVFGVGFLFAEDAPWAEAMTQHVGPLHEHPLLAALERNRLALYMRVLELQDEGERRRRAVDRTIAELNAQVAALESENAALRLAAAEAHDGGAPAAA